MRLEQRPLGRTGRTIPCIGLGCVTFGREIDEEASFRILDYAVEQGITFLDTAEVYGGGQARSYRKNYLGVEDVREVSGEMSSSERILGRWLRARNCRDAVTICTKVSTGGGPENIARALGASLERLGLDRVDVYKMHSPDPNTPIEETLGALDSEVKAGRIGAIGSSNYSAAQMREALSASAGRGYARFEITQPSYSLADRDAEKELFSVCRSEQIAVTSYSPLGAGFLAGKYTPDRNQFPKGSRFDVIPGHADVYFSDRNFRVVERLRDKAAQLGLPMVRLAMAWAMTNPDVTAVLIGARTQSHIDNALAAHDLHLDPGLRAEMSAWE
jgi:aryl-alcohol dehydrogenase-like predicted oxidoreductase